MSSTEKIVLTGIQPTGMPHFGNYIAALKPAIAASQTQKTFMFIADLHALNSIHDAKVIREHTYQAAALLISLGLNLENAVLFRQSDIDEIYQINTYYPSSQTCSKCKIKNRNLKDLSIREWECPNCHFIHDRDINASLNILDEGIKLYLKDLNQELKV